MVKKDLSLACKAGSTSLQVNQRDIPLIDQREEFLQSSQLNNNKHSIIFNTVFNYKNSQQSNYRKRVSQHNEGICGKSTVNITSGENRKVFPLRSGTRASILPFLLNTVLLKQESSFKSKKGKKERNKKWSQSEWKK